MKVKSHNAKLTEILSVLDPEKPKTATEIAREIGHYAASLQATTSITTMLKKMARYGWVSQVGGSSPVKWRRSPKYAVCSGCSGAGVIRCDQSNG